MAPAEQFSQILPKNESLTFLRDETESRLILDY